MNENINLCKILKDCPINTEFYSPIIGNCKLSNVNSYDVVVANSKAILYINPDATATFYGHKTVELMLFPSQTQRDWSKWQCPKPKKPKFDPKTLQPFDKILVSSYNNEWLCRFVSHIVDKKVYTTSGCHYNRAIPYNNDTKHLVGTFDEAPEYYRYWEE